MNYGFRIGLLTLAFALVATVTFASPAGEDAGAAVEKEMVTDPTTGKMVTAPEYGGTLTVTLRGDPPTVDTYYRHPPAIVAGLVVEKLGIGDWGVSRDKFDFRTTYLPTTSSSDAWPSAGSSPTPRPSFFTSARA